MLNILKAAGSAFAMLLLWGVAMLVPGLNVLGLIAVMLPLWMVHNIGVHGLGEPREGFFVPTPVGFVVGALILWTLVFLVALAIHSRKRSKQ